MNKNEIPHLSDDLRIESYGAFEYEDQQLWDNTLMDGLKEIEVDEVIDKVRNYYNNCCEIDGRPPSKLDFNEFLNTLK